MMLIKVATLVAVLAAVPAAPEQARPRRPNVAGGGAAWTVPRTPDGQPDLQGIWTNATITPFERPANQRDKAFLSAEEAEALERQAAVRRDEDGPPRPGDVGSYNQVWFDSGNRVVPSRRTSLVIDPPDGRVPLTAAAEAARDANAAHERDSFEFMSVWDRCITRGVPSGMFPAGYNNAYQIVQTPGYVVIHYEMIHEARIIPLDGRPHVPGALRLWNGDPRGRWEGDTLVVDTTNYNSKGWIATQAAAGRIKGVPQTEALHVVERFTPIDANTIDYQTTIDDPTMFTRPWTVAIPLHRDPTYQIFEYACHEGNRSVENILRDARALDADQTGAQSVQYRSPEGVEYRSLPETEAIKTARAALDANPRDIARIIDLGIAQSGARQFREAIATFTRGLEIEPNNALLLRWRGHRYLSVREFDRAYADLTRGSAIDPTIYGIWYHLGVVQYLRGDFAGAAASFAKAQPIAPDAGELAGSTDWLWMSLSRAGRGADAKAMLDRRPDSKPVINAYTRRLQLYRGEIGPDAVVTAADTDDVQVATLAYGLGNWYLVRGDTAQARRWFERSIQSGGWPGFGFIVSEVELRRLR